jgi:single-strand DNA-binding protein
MTSDAADPASDNHVFLRGRLAELPLEKELPSGDVLLTFRLTVLRPPGERVRVDSLECSSTRPRVHKSLARAQPGDEVEVTGCLRRRFWRSAAGPASRYAVDALAVRVKRPARTAATAKTVRPDTVVKARARARRAGQPVDA